MIVKGMEVRHIDVSVDEYEALKGIAYELGCGSALFDDSRDTRWMPEYNGTAHDLSALREETDISYHGSPCWEPTGHKITDSDALRAYTSIKALLQIMKERKERAK